LVQRGRVQKLREGWGRIEAWGKGRKAKGKLGRGKG